MRRAVPSGRRFALDKRQGDLGTLGGMNARGTTAITTTTTTTVVRVPVRD